MEETLFTCPYCEAQLQIPEDAWYYTCDQCSHRLDLKSQFAFLRGLDAFDEGQEIMKKINPKKLRRDLFMAQARAAMLLFMEAYSSLQVAFQAELEETQRCLGVEMMSSMSQEFLKRLMISQLEMSYWKTLMVEQNAQNEYDLLKEKLNKQADSWGFYHRWRWTSRQKKLAKSLAQLDNKIKSLEDQIEFVDLPRARNTKWKP